MKRYSTLLMALVVTLSAMAGDLVREHRAIWMSPFLGSNWPSAAITQGNAESSKRILRNRLDVFASQGINVLYYHVRSMCDATYDSAYEPWASTVGGKRGQAPYYDPFGYLVEQAHERGIEVYAWVNPYRYCNQYSYGEGELNYENSHPDWLLTTPSQTILNPGLPQVRQRICEVITDIVTKYDVDGVLFDDYFYTSGTDLALDADLYNAYKDEAGAGAMSQMDWRRNNVNMMVHDVNTTIKSLKPWVVFAISPAGTASPLNVETEYGLPPGPYGDWQYGGIASDPLHWIKYHDIDFISPQIYWPWRFTALLDWWNMAVEKFGRHLYYSTDLSEFNTYKTQTFVDQINYVRERQIENQGGIVFFQYGTFVNGSSEKYYDNKMRTFGENLSLTVFNTRVLTPLRHWDGKREPVYTANVRVEGDSLRWDAVEGARYTVYAVPQGVDPATVMGDLHYLYTVRYTNSMAIPDDVEAATWAVGVYDRYGNEYAALAAGQTMGEAVAPVLQSPVSGEAPALFEFRWSGNASRYVLEVSETEGFDELVAKIETTDTCVNSASVPTLTTGQQYWWRVRSIACNSAEGVSPAANITVSTLRVLSPVNGTTGVDLMPRIEWSAAEQGAEYAFSVATDRDFKNVVYEITTDQTGVDIPDFTLRSGACYFARVTATLGESTTTSATSWFTTLDVDDYTCPAFANPTADGATLWANSVISVEPWRGMYSVTVNVASSTSFPARNSYVCTLLNFATEVNTDMENMKVGSKYLVDGETYYLRARAAYNLAAGSNTVYTDYSPVWSFVYSSETGVTALQPDAVTFYVDADCNVFVPQATRRLTVTDMAGRTVLVLDNPRRQVSLAALAHGVYVVRADGRALKWVR